MIIPFFTPTSFWKELNQSILGVNDSGAGGNSLSFFHVILLENVSPIQLYNLYNNHQAFFFNISCKWTLSSNLRFLYGKFSLIEYAYKSSYKITVTGPVFQFNT
ncbi:MAG: hypothetical protein ACKPKO_29025, partial [Candidatus Fonsibacter sp.]